MTASNAALKIDPTFSFMTIQSDVLGPLEVPETDIIQFANGLFGFPECRQFVLIKAERDGIFWLQSAEHSSLTFLLADPFLFFDEYSVDLPATETDELGVESPDDVIVLTIVTLPAHADEKPTVNLQGPVAVNMSNRSARQVVLQDADYGTRCPVTL